MKCGETLYITASGRPKGALSREEILEIGPATPPPPLRPSAEISIHQTLYRLFPEISVVLHVHTVEATLLSDSAGQELRLPPLEVLKGLGFADPSLSPPLPVFENDPDVSKIARMIEKRLLPESDPLPGLLIRHHGTTAWGRDMDSALRHLELLEFCFRYLILRQRE